MARAIASICCSPPLKLPASWPRRSRSRGNKVNARSSAGSASSRRVNAPNWRFSSTVMRASIPRPSGTWTTRRRTIWCTGRPTRSSPPKRTAPWRGRTTPEIARNSVVFPAPLAPISATTAASGTARLTPCTARIFP